MITDAIEFIAYPGLVNWIGVRIYILDKVYIYPLMHCDNYSQMATLCINLTEAFKQVMAIEWAKQFIEVPVNESD